MSGLRIDRRVAWEPTSGQTVGSFMDSGHYPKVLLVEDDSLIAMALQWEFESADFEVVGVAHSEQTALLAAHETAANVAVVDYTLATGTGESAAVMLRRAGVKVIMATGVVRSARARTALQGLWCLEKPYAPRRAVQAARDLLETEDPNETAAKRGYLVL
jgi:ActR/RegA family two-component response regulator